MESFIHWIQSERNVILIKVVICAVIGLAVGFWGRYRNRTAPRSRFRLALILGLVGLVAVGAYFRFGKIRKGSYVNYHDVFNYFMGSKYHAEVGYGNLYTAVALADLETNQRFRVADSFRDLRNLKIRPRSSAPAEAQRVLAPFTAERWREFKADVLWLGGRAAWGKQLMTDMGHNATPFWSAWAGDLLEWVPWGADDLIFWIACIDLLLLLVLFAGVAWAFGWVPMWIALLLFLTNYSSHFWTIKGSILRFDWLVAMGLSVCLIYKKYYKTAGALMAYAVLVRIFPLLFIFGLGVKSLLGVVRDHRWPVGHGPFWMTFWFTCAVGVGGSMMHAGGMQQWSSFVSKLDDHSRHIAGRRIGLHYAWHDEGSKTTAQVAKRAREWRGPIQYSILAATLLIAGWLAARVEDGETFALGVPLLFFNVNATWYYYVVLLIPYLVFVSRLDRSSFRQGVLLLTALSIGSYLVALTYFQDIMRNTTISTLLLIVLPLMCLLLWWGRRERQAGERAVLSAGAMDVPQPNR